MLEALHLSKSYSQGKTSEQILHNISFRIEQKDFITIQGKSGSGKSTLLHLLGGLDFPDEGDILFHQKNLKDFSQKDWLHFRRFDVSFIFQFFHLFPRLTVLENIMLPAEIAQNNNVKTQKLAKDLAHQVGLEGQISQYAQTLSGGQMQRVAIARALINSPHILFADEPTGNLDSKSSENILTIIQELHQQHGMAICMVTHDKTVFELGHKKYEILDGLIKQKV